MTSLALRNICFHGVGDPQRVLEPNEDRYWISYDEFRRILDALADTSVTVNISFDDGNASDLTIGMPELLSRGLRATFFVLAGRLESRGSLGVDDVVALRDGGMSIGTHGMNHVPWPRLDAAAKRRELVEARERLSDVTGLPIEAAALPLGRYDRRLLADLRKLRYRSVNTSDRRLARTDSWIQPRFSIRADDTASSVRSSILQPPTLVRRLRSEAVGFVKRIR